MWTVTPMRAGRRMSGSDSALTVDVMGAGWSMAWTRAPQTCSNGQLNHATLHPPKQNHHQA
eukprot:1729712-Rhodomonas_salina.4